MNVADKNGYLIVKVILTCLRNILLTSSNNWWLTNTDICNNPPYNLKHCHDRTCPRFWLTGFIPYNFM